MNLHDPLNDSEAKPRPANLFASRLSLLARPRFIDAVKAIEQIGEMLFSDARPVVLHASNAPLLLLAGQFNMHALANAAGILDGVLDQIGEHTTKIVRIAA